MQKTVTKTFVITQFIILAVVSGVISVLTFFTGGIVAHHWDEFFDGNKTLLPSVTVFATKYGY